MQRQTATVNDLQPLARVVDNVSFFEMACCELETLLVTLRASRRSDTITLSSLSSFRTTVDLTRSRIVGRVNRSLDQFYEDRRYDRTITRSSPVDSCSDFEDGTQYLGAVMEHRLGLLQ